MSRWGLRPSSVCWLGQGDARLPGASCPRPAPEGPGGEGAPAYLSLRLSMKRFVKALTLSTRAP